MDQYRGYPGAGIYFAIVAVANDEIVGAAVATGPGSCRLCDQEAPSVPAFSHADQVEQEFQFACRKAHLQAALPAHMHVQTVATDPFLQGCGIGRLLLAELAARAVAAGAACVALECLTTRAGFYERIGFGAVDDFADPGGDGLRSVLMTAEPGSLVSQT